MNKTIYSGYRGKLEVVLDNGGHETFDRVTQLILEKIYTPVFEVVPFDKLSKTMRGANGFGSTGI